MKDCYFDLSTRAIVDVIPNLLQGGYIISRVNTPEKSRGQGYARKLLSDVLADADSEGEVLWLGINPYGPMSFRALEAWYKRLGFKKFGPNWYRRSPGGT